HHHHHHMLEAKFEEASLFKRIIDGFKDYVQLVNFQCKEDGIIAQAVDDSRVLLVSLEIGVEAFQEYRCDHPVTLGMDLTSLSKILRCGNNTDTLTLIADNTPDSIILLFEDTKKDRIAEYSLKLMDIDADFLKIEELQYDSTLSLPSSEFSKIVRDLSQLSDSINIMITKETIKFVADGDIGSGSVIIKPFVDMEHPETSIKLEMDQPVDLTFGAKYLLDIIKGSSLSDRVGIRLSSEAPALFQFDLKSGFLQFFLAPKFNDEE
uniref:Proliferating cell nuclear antigen n=1 Tax=Saccharomyces cerevisiae (strain ATCC 204508 / S288c) TaxID=559292 RepID=UPI0005092A9E|nr:Chain A, Proliferating cell nuclear antigen [Saccharomyces cerevisiae S288C]4L6P_B Chain B, Proliferating cell nuclear antigen [Saccharomyces cerevisiae S288C]4L6P_C Chain C, Proliferating cell nuclear antigen [Saccharomyces cerevisiae S288C]